MVLFQTMNFNRNIIVFIVFMLICSEFSLLKAERNLKPTIFFSAQRSAEAYRAIMNEFQQCTDPINIGVDYTDDELPKVFRDALVNAVNSDPLLNQYSPNMGSPRILKAIANLYSYYFYQTLIPEENFVVTIGATEALHIALLALTSPGDEWIIIEPAYTRYVPMIKMAKGVPRFATLKLQKTTGNITSDHWKLDEKELEGLFNKKTRGILINNPNNPTGKGFLFAELIYLKSLVLKWDVLVISDEVHEWITYEGQGHFRIASLSRMFDRTITISSASKTFGVTGWRVGWAYGPVDLINKLKFVHANSVHSAPTPQQEAIAVILEREIKNYDEPESYIFNHAMDVMNKRDFMLKSFVDVGMLPTRPFNGNCMLVNWTALIDSKIDFKNEEGYDNGTKFNNWMKKNIGVYGVPLSVFYNAKNNHLGEDYIRYCFVKKAETLEKAATRLLKLKLYQ